MENEGVFNEVSELQEIETHLNFIFGHLRKIQKEGGEGLYRQINDYFYSKYGTVFCKETLPKRSDN